MATSRYRAYIGCYSGLDGGIHVLDINAKTGDFSRRNSVTGIANPTFVIVNKACTKLYAGVSQLDGRPKAGGVAVFDILEDDLKLSSFQPSNSKLPCHVALDKNEKTLFAANYAEGTASVFPLDAKGDILPEMKHLVHQGNGPNPKRQLTPHVHFATVTPDNKLVYFVDLGIDTVKAYNYDAGKGDLAPVPEADIHTAPGAGPRHLLFTRGGSMAYVINEVDSTVSVFRQNGIAFNCIQTLSLLPERYPKAEDNTASAIKITEDGSRLLCSNRGYDSIAVFEVNRETGLLSLLAINPTMGRGPRDFAILPGDQFVLVAHQYTDNVICFRFDSATGTFTPVGKQLLIPQGVCIQLAASI